MIIIKYPAPAIETAASRYDRDWLNIPGLDTEGHADDRHDRTLLQQTVERKSRRYVDDNVSAVTNSAPVFDPNSGVITNPDVPGGGSWTDTFAEAEINSRWQVFEGGAITNPLRVAPGQEYARLVTAEPLSGYNAEITVNTTFSGSGMLSFGFWVKDDAGQFDDGPYANAELGSTYIAVSARNMGYETTEQGSSDLQSLTYRVENNVSTIFINGVTYPTLSGPLSQDYIGMELYPMIVLMGGAESSITSVKVTELDSTEPNDGGTSEPEPEIPSESPAGTYTTNYTETY